MRKHLLSTYGNFYKHIEMVDSQETACDASAVEKTYADDFLAIGGTTESRSQENSDPDEFIFGTTSITKTIESTDEDELFLGSTMITENVEVSDPDELFLQETTNLTFTQENADEDEFALLPNALRNFNDIDFDTILLI